MNLILGCLPECLLLGFSFCTLFQNFVVNCARPTADDTQKVSVPGDITLGGLFPMFLPNKDGECSVINSALGIELLEALLFSVDRINANKTFLPNITLGVKAFDTCGSETAALDRAVKEFVLGEKFSTGVGSCTNPSRPVVGVIGPGYSSEAVHIVPFLGLFGVPVISYSATSPELSDKSKYEYFSRTSTSDSLQGEAIVELLEHYNWTYVSILYSDESYGRSGFAFIKTEAKKRGICFATKAKLPLKYSQDKYQRIVHDIVSNQQAKTVVLFCIESVISPLMKEIQRQIGSEKLQFIGSETLGMLKEWVDIRSTARGVMFTHPLSRPVKEFNAYFLNLTVDENTRNPWFSYFFQEAMNCSFEKNISGPSGIRTTCYSSQTLQSLNYSTELETFNLIHFVVDGVYAFAHALQFVHGNRCRDGNDETKCEAMYEVSGKEFLDVIRRTTFKSLTGSTVNFSSNGDVFGGYGIYVMDEVDDGMYKNIKIGEWQDELKMGRSPWKRGFQPAESRCWESCNPGQIRQGVPEKPSCCFKCVTCPINAFVFNETTCRSCAKGYKPDGRRRMCVPIKTKYFTVDGQVIPFYVVLFPVVASGFSILAIVFTVFVFIRFNDTPLVKASGRELSYLLLVGLSLSFLFPFVSILKPSSFSCLLQFVLDSLPFTISLVAIVVKNNRTYRIFNPNRVVTIPPSFIHPRAQIVISLGLISIQVLLLTVLAVVDFPHPRLIYSSHAEVHLVCSISKERIYLVNLYNYILLVACTYYAYKTRRFPRNFNEAKYIAFAMYGVCMMSLAFFVVSETTSNRQSGVYRRLAMRCYRVTFSAGLLLMGIFAPKLYIVLLKPEENRRHLPTHGKSTVAALEQGEIILHRLNGGKPGYVWPCSSGKVRSVKSS